MSRKGSEKIPKSRDGVRLGTCRFRPESRRLQDGAGQVVPLRSQTSDVLAHLLRRRGEVVSKAELFAAVWPDRAVTDDSLVQCISELRRALADRDRTLIQTLPKQGYMLADDVTGATEAAAGLPLPSKPSIAVLAFDDISTGPDARFLSDAIAEGIIGDLSRFPELFVIARNSSFRFRDTATDVTQISHALGVKYLLEGSQQKSGARVRVNVRLIHAETGHHLWSDRYEHDLSNLFVLQDDIVRRVVATVAQKVIRDEGRRAGRSDAAKLTALRHHLRARLHLVKFTPEGNEKARQADLAAIEADPSQPYGHVGLAFGYVNAVRWGWTDLSRAAALDKARSAAQAALDLAPDYYDGHAAMAAVRLEEGDLDRAVARGRRVLELNPNDTNGMCSLADCLGYLGRTDEAEQLILKAMRLDPLHPDWMRWTLAWIYWIAGRYTAALDSLNAMADMPPMALRVLAITLVGLGRIDDAKAAVARLLAAVPGYAIADVHRDYGDKFRDRKTLDRLIDSLRQAGLPD